MRGTFLFNYAAEKSLSAAWLVQIRKTFVCAKAVSHKKKRSLVILRQPDRGISFGKLSGRKVRGLRGEGKLIF